MPDPYEQTVQNLKLTLRETPAGKLLLRYGFEPIDTESAARRVAEKAVEEIERLTAALKAASDHLEYCGYGDAWEREGTEGLRNQIADALTLTS